MNVERLENRLLLATLPQGFAESVFVRGFDTPVAMEFAPDGRLFVAEKAGTIRVIKNGTLLPQPFLSLRVDTFRERGLQSIAFDPKFSSNRYVYAFYARTDDNTKNRISRFRASASNPDLAEPGSETIILDNLPTPTAFHNGGSMHFGPDGMLYVGIGDGGSRAADAQVLSSLSGKILRLNVAAFPNIIPPDNPFVATAGARKEIYALGFRNPFTSGFDPKGGRFFVNDVGSDKFEEINDVVAGRNYGWPAAEGSSSDNRFTDPVHFYPHSFLDAAITGGAFYRASQFPAEYSGSYFFADYTKGWIRRLDQRDNDRVIGFATGAEGPIDLDIGPDGSLYYLSAFGDGYSGTNRPVVKISYIGSNNRAPIAFVKASPTSGPNPLIVRFNASWSRDPDGDKLRYHWDFGDGRSDAGRRVIHTFSSVGQYDVLLTVSDIHGSASSPVPIRITVGSTPPVAKIRLPKAQLFRAGDTLRFAGTGADKEDGKLPASAFHWSVVFHHNKHTHPFITSIDDVKNGSFRIPITGETDPRQFYRIHLTVRDSDGLEHSTFRDIRPLTSRLTLRTNVPGLSLNLDGQPRSSPFSIVSVEGMRRTLAAPLFQTYQGTRYQFVEWSNAKRAEHQFRTPEDDTIYTATYRAV